MSMNKQAQIFRDDSPNDILKKCANNSYYQYMIIQMDAKFRPL